MKKSFAVLSAALLAICGCSQGTPGGPGVRQQPISPPVSSQTAHKPIIGEAMETFTLSVPLLATSLKQGETKSVDISISRGTNFDGDVMLSFSELPTGITVNPARPAIKHGDAQVSITVAAAEDAALGDFVVKVTGQPSKGAVDAVNDLKLTVSEK